MIYAGDDPTTRYVTGVWSGRRDMFGVSIAVDAKRGRMLCIKRKRRRGQGTPSTYIPLNKERTGPIVYAHYGRVRLRLDPTAPAWVAEMWRARGALVIA